jgi:hypothetical protein
MTEEPPLPGCAVKLLLALPTLIFVSAISDPWEEIVVSFLAPKIGTNEAALVFLYSLFPIMFIGWMGTLMLVDRIFGTKFSRHD